MKKLSVLCLFAVFCSVSCTMTDLEHLICKDLTFNADECVDINSSKWKIQREIVLESTSGSLLSNNEIGLLIDNKDLFLFDKTGVLRFDRDGKFINSIGRLGHGKGEYTAVTDVTLNKDKNMIEVLSPNYIHKFDYEGNIKEKTSLSLPATSFLYDNSCYWVGTGHTTDILLYKLNEKGEEVATYLENDFKIPVMEDNFGKGTIKTFRDSFSHDIYHMNGDTIILAYRMNFPGLDLPKSIYSSDIDKVSDDLKSKNYMMIRRFIENQQYIYMLLTENVSSGKTENMYHWIIEKKSNKQICIKLTLDDIMKNPYHLNAQVLTEDNILYCVGYVNVENKEALNNNPSVVLVDLKKIFE